MGRAYQNRKLSIAKTSDAKAKVYSRYGREIYVSAKSGGVDPAYMGLGPVPAVRKVLKSTGMILDDIHVMGAVAAGSE